MNRDSIPFLIVWLFFGLLSAGFMNRSLEHGDYRWSTKEKCEEMAASAQSGSILMAVGGPISLVVVLGMSGFGYNGWSLYRYDCKYGS